MQRFDLSLNIKLTDSAFKRLVVLSSLLFSMHAEALVLLQQASASFGTDYDDNPTMADTNKTTVMRYSFNPKYNISAVDDINTWFASAGLNVQRSSNKNITIDRDDPNFNFGWTRALERGSFGLNASYSKASTRITEIDESGRVLRDGDSTTKSIGANFTHLITERLSINSGAQYLKKDFSVGNFTGYTSKSLNTGLSYQLTEKISPFAQVSWTDYKSEGLTAIDRKSQNYSAGANFILSPRLNYGLSAGISHVENTGNGRIYGANATYLGDRYNLKASLGRSISPSSLGGFQESDNLSIGYGYELSAISRFGADISWRRNNSFNDSESGSVSGFYSRDLTEYWQMRLSARHRTLKTINNSAEGNSAGITFTYNIPEF